MPDPSPVFPEVFTLLNGDLKPRCQEIEIASSVQIPNFSIIGLPGPEVSEAKDRIRAAIEASGFEFPKRKLILNLSPASVRKEGTGLDLAMAVAVLIESWKIERKPAPGTNRRIFAWGELGLDGRVKPVRSPARGIAAAIRGAADMILVAKADETVFRRAAGELFAREAVPPILGISHFREAEGAIRVSPPPYARDFPAAELPPGAAARPALLPIPRATAEVLQVAAAGSHHFLLLGPKGVGKSLALEWFLALQPAIDGEIARTRRFLSEISGREAESPFRRIGTQVKPPALVGSYAGGSLRPGEFSLAHGGVLLADEFPEWSRDAREALREPLERKRVTLTRVDGVVDLPADFIFAGNGNLCPCGGVPDPPADGRSSPCRCHPNDRVKYLARLTGPVLDRLDLVIRLYGGPGEIAGERPQTYADLGAKTAAARSVLLARHGAAPGKLSPEALEDFLARSPSVRTSLDAINFRSFRDRHKTLRIGLTLAALRDRAEPDAEILRQARALRLGA